MQVGSLPKSVAALGPSSVLLLGRKEKAGGFVRSKARDAARLDVAFPTQLPPVLFRCRLDILAGNRKHPPACLADFRVTLIRFQGYRGRSYRRSQVGRAPTTPSDAPILSPRSQTQLPAVRRVFLQ